MSNASGDSPGAGRSGTKRWSATESSNFALLLATWQVFQEVADEGIVPSQSSADIAVLLATAMNELAKQNSRALVLKLLADLAKQRNMLGFVTQKLQSLLEFRVVPSYWFLLSVDCALQPAMLRRIARALHEVICVCLLQDWSQHSAQPFNEEPADSQIVTHLASGIPLQVFRLERTQRS